MCTGETDTARLLTGASGPGTVTQGGIGMSIERATGLVARMMRDPQFTRRVTEAPEETLADLDLTDAELEAVLSDAETISTLWVLSEVSSGSENGLRFKVTTLPDFDRRAFAAPLLPGDSGPGPG